MNITKVSRFIKNKYFLLTLISLLALFIRLLNIDKSFGLWYDEMLTYLVASKSFPMGIIKSTLLYDFHMPLYYLYAHVWMQLFGSNDIVLRLSSVIFGVLTIPAGFLLGKTYKNEKLGLFLAAIMCLNPLMIYYSQEFRFYSIVMFLSTVSMIYIIRLIKAPKKKDAFFFGAANLIMLYVYSTSCIFVFFEFLALFIHFYFYNKENFKNFVKFTAIFFAFSIPYIAIFISFMAATKTALILPFANYDLNPYFAIVIINDWFSPFITSLFTQDLVQYARICKTPAGIIVLGFMLSSTACFVVGLFSSLKNKSKIYFYLVFVALSFFIVESMLYVTGQFFIMTKYTVVILPIILLICTDGLLLINNKTLKKACITIICVVYIYNTINYKNMISFSTRQGGTKFPTNIINAYIKGSSNYYILYPDRSELFKKYIQNYEEIPLDAPAVLHLDKTKKEALKCFDKEFVYSTNGKNALEKFSDYLINPNPTPELKNYINTNIYKIPKGYKLIYVNAKFDNIPFEEIQKIIKSCQNDKALYSKTLFHFVSQKIFWDTKHILNTNPKLKKIKTIEQQPNKGRDTFWVITIYEKQ